MEFHFISQCFKTAHIFLWCNPFSAVYCVHKSRVCSIYTSDYYLNCVLLHILIGVMRSDKMLHTTKSTDRTKSKNQNCISFCVLSLYGGLSIYDNHFCGRVRWELCFLVLMSMAYNNSNIISINIPLNIRVDVFVVVVVICICFVSCFFFFSCSSSVSFACIFIFHFD